MRLWLTVPFLAAQITLSRGAAAQSPTPPDASPVALMREFLTRDARGDRLRTDPWMAQHTLWGHVEPGWDGYQVIIGYKLRTIHADSSTARIAITYDVTGTVDVDTSAHYIRKPSTQTVTFTLALTDVGWRIVAPTIEPHVLGTAISPRTSFSAADWALLREDMRRVKQGS